MNPSQIYILISVVILAILFLLLFFVKKEKPAKRLTPLAGFAFAFVLSGIIFGDNRLIGYSLMGFGVLLAVVDIIFNLKKR